MGLNGKTPSEVTGIQVNGKNKWISLIQNTSKSADWSFKLRKETSASLKAGAVSAAPIGCVFSIFVSIRMMTTLKSQFNIESTLGSNANTILLFANILLVVMGVALFSFFGAIAGFIFVKTANKLPFQSTYVKAVPPWSVLLSLSVFGDLVYNLSSGRARFFVTRQLVSYADVLGGAILFAYLFNRWTNQHHAVANEPIHQTNGNTTINQTRTWQNRKKALSSCRRFDRKTRTFCVVKNRRVDLSRGTPIPRLSSCGNSCFWLSPPSCTFNITHIRRDFREEKIQRMSWLWSRTLAKAANLVENHMR